MNDLYLAKVEFTQSITKSGRISNNYSIVQVIDFQPATMVYQTELKLDNDES